MILKKPIYMIPVGSPQELRERIENFYKENKKEVVEEYARNLSEDISLSWGQRGLENISTPGGGFDLDRNMPRFSFHNIHEDSDLGKSLIKIADKYAELLME